MKNRWSQVSIVCWIGVCPIVIFAKFEQLKLLQADGYCFEEKH